MHVYCTEERTRSERGKGANGDGNAIGDRSGVEFGDGNGDGAGLE